MATPATHGVVVAEMRDCETSGSKPERHPLALSPRIFISPRPLSVRPSVRPPVRPSARTSVRTVRPPPPPFPYSLALFRTPVAPPRAPARAGGKTPTRSRAHPSSALAHRVVESVPTRSRGREIAAAQRGASRIRKSTRTSDLFNAAVLKENRRGI